MIPYTELMLDVTRGRSLTDLFLIIPLVEMMFCISRTHVYCLVCGNIMMHVKIVQLVHNVSIQLEGVTRNEMYIV